MGNTNTQETNSQNTNNGFVSFMSDIGPNTTVRVSTEHLDRHLAQMVKKGERSHANYAVDGETGQFLPVDVDEHGNVQELGGLALGAVAFGVAIVGSYFAYRAMDKRVRARFEKLAADKGMVLIRTRNGVSYAGRLSAKRSDFGWNPFNIRGRCSSDNPCFAITVIWCSQASVNKLIKKKGPQGQDIPHSQVDFIGSYQEAAVEIEKEALDLCVTADALTRPEMEKLLEYHEKVLKLRVKDAREEADRVEKEDNKKAKARAKAENEKDKESKKAKSKKDKAKSKKDKAKSNDEEPSLGETIREVAGSAVQGLKDFLSKPSPEGMDEAWKADKEAIMANESNEEPASESPPRDEVAAARAEARESALAAQNEALKARIAAQDQLLARSKAKTAEQRAKAKALAADNDALRNAVELDLATLSAMGRNEIRALAKKRGVNTKGVGNSISGMAQRIFDAQSESEQAVDVAKAS